MNAKRAAALLAFAGWMPLAIVTALPNASAGDLTATALLALAVTIIAREIAEA